MKTYVNPISNTYPPTIETVEGVYGQHFENTDENVKKLHFNQAIDEIDILTNQNNTPIRKYYKKLSPEQKDYALKALARLYAYFVIINQTYVKGNLEASQGDTNINYQFNYPKNIDPQVYNLLQMAGLYQQNKTVNLGNNEDWNKYHNPYHDEHTYQKLMQMEPISKKDAWIAFLGNNKITSKDNSISLNWTFDQINGVYLDLSAHGHAPTPISFGDSLLKIKDKWEVVKLKDDDGKTFLDYNLFNKTYVDGNLVISKSPDLDIKFAEGALEFILKTHQEAFGDSLKEINNKYEVVKLKNSNGTQTLTYDEIHTNITNFVNFLSNKSIQFFTSALKDKVISYYYHTDGEFSFHYWQNPSLITTYKKPEAYTFTQLFGINQNPRITDWSPYIEYDFNANTGEIDLRLASFKKTGAGWDKKIYLVFKTEEGDTTFDFKKNPATFQFKNKTYNVQETFDKIHDRPSHKEIAFNKEVLNWKRTNANIKENGNTVEVHGLDNIIRNTKWVGKTLQFEFVRCAGDEEKLHGNQYVHKVYSVIFEADKLPALNTSTWTKVFKMDSRVQWWLSNRGEIKTEHWNDCVQGAPTIELKLETIGYYLKFTWVGFKRWWDDATINFSTKSYWDTFKIVADVYK